MPAIMTHDFFGRDVLRSLPKAEEYSQREREAFLLGNQGPDPLFYLRADPFRKGQAKLGNLMHGQRTDELLAALKEALAFLNPRNVAIARAYAQGFLCHYVLDSAMHPLVYFQQFRICDAGVEGLTRESGSAVHAVIESEFDEMVLWNKYELTIADYAPRRQILHASDEDLDIIGELYIFMASQVYDRSTDLDMFKTAVRCFRLEQEVMYSPKGVKREAVAHAEELFMRHRYSVLRGMAHQAEPRETVWYANNEHEIWRNPWTGEWSDRSFWDIYHDACSRAVEMIGRFEATDFSRADAREMTGRINFSGKPLPA